jgi:hypothetical protein
MKNIKLLLLTLTFLAFCFFCYKFFDDNIAIAERRKFIIPFFGLGFTLLYLEWYTKRKKHTQE